MTSFVHTEYSFEHPGVARAENLAHTVGGIAHRFDGARGAATLLLAAVVAAVLVVANQIIDTWTEGHLMVMWVGMWLVAFAALALLAVPMRRLVVGLRRSGQRRASTRQKARADAAYWAAARSDARLMSDISVAMTHRARMPLAYY